MVNFFYLDNDPKICAQYYCNKHIIKIPIEIAQILSKIHYELKSGINKPEVWKEFYKRILELKEQTVSFIKAEKAKGKTFMAIGASTKANTTLQMFGLDHHLIYAISERNPMKHGLKCVGSNIPIISEEELRKAKPDYVIVNIWHFIDEILKREKQLLLNGTKIIVLCPQFKIISG